MTIPLPKYSTEAYKPGSDEAKKAIAQKILYPVIEKGGDVDKTIDGMARSEMMAQDVFTTYDKNHNNIIEPNEIPKEDADLYAKYFDFENKDGKPDTSKPIPTNFVDATVNYFKKYYTEKNNSSLTNQ